MRTFKAAFRRSPSGHRQRLIAWAPWLALVGLLFFAYGMAFIWGHYRLLDLRVYMGGAHELLIGNDPYNFGFTSVHLFPTYPPFALMVLSPVSLVPMHALVYIWSLLSLGCLAWLCSIALSEVRTAVKKTNAAFGLLELDRVPGYLLALIMALVAAITLETVRANFGFGQVNIFLMTMVAIDVLRRGRSSRGVLVGIAAAFKLTPLIFVLLFLLDRDKRAAVRSLITFVAATGIAWLIRPSLSAQYYFHFRVVEKRIGSPSYVSNQSVNGIFARLGLSGTYSTVVWVLASLVVVAFASFATAKLLRPDRSALPALVVMATAGLLVSPVSWDHHWCWVVLFPFALFDPSLRRPARGVLLAVVAVAVAAPYWWSGTSTSYGIPTGFASPVADDSLALAALAFIGAVVWSVRGQPSVLRLPAWASPFRRLLLQADGGHTTASLALRAKRATPSDGESRGKGETDGARIQVLRPDPPWTRQSGAR